MTSAKALAYARGNRKAHLDSLCDWLRIPSVSTLPEHDQDVRWAAEWAANKLAEVGFEDVVITETSRHPLVYAERLGLEAATLLIYGHFDVQPVDPLDEWQRPPFEPIVDGENVYARGASDDKGQTFTILAALESYLESGAELPINVKILLEGEEENVKAAYDLVCSVKGEPPLSTKVENCEICDKKCLYNEKA